MVTNVSNLTRNGFSDWIVQRLTAIILLIYTPLIIGFFLFSSDISYESLNAFFEQLWVRIFTLLAIISISAHAWIGLWTISTDYMSITLVRVSFQVFYVMALIVFTVWSIDVLWRF